MKPIRWGILGCGDVTEVKSGPGFQKADGSTLVAVMRRDAAKAEDYARRHGVPRWYSDADAFLADPEIDAVYIATPPGTHELYAMKTLAAGKPCYLEKPMSRNASEARRMVDAFARAKVPLFVAYYRRALPRFLRIRESIRMGTFGQVRSVAYTYSDGQHRRRIEPVPWRFRAEESGGGLFLDLASHVLDMLDFWLGPLALVGGKVSNESNTYAVEDHVSAVLSANGIAVASIIFDHTREPRDEFVIAFDRAIVRMSCFGSTQVRVTSRDDAKAETMEDLPNPPHIAQPMIQTVVDALRSTGTCESTGDSALRTQQLIDDILRPYYGSREDGFWNLAWPGVPGRTTP